MTNSPNSPESRPNLTLLVFWISWLVYLVSFALPFEYGLEKNEGQIGFDAFHLYWELMFDPDFYFDEFDIWVYLVNASNVLMIASPLTLFIFKARIRVALGFFLLISWVHHFRFQDIFPWDGWEPEFLWIAYYPWWLSFLFLGGALFMLGRFQSAGAADTN